MENNQTMKASELRINNLVLAEVGLLSPQIHSVMAKDIADLERGIAKCYPIPLTEEWLLRMGFTNIDTTSIYVKSMHKIGANKLKSLAIYINENNYTVATVDYYTGVEKIDLLHLDYEYVHQLQNLYFALTNQELETKSEIEKL